MKKMILAAAGGAVLGLVATTQVAAPLLAQEAQSNTSVYEQLDLFGDIFERIRSNYVEEVDDRELIEAAINAHSRASPATFPWPSSVMIDSPT